MHVSFDMHVYTSEQLYHLIQMSNYYWWL